MSERVTDAPEATETKQSSSLQLAPFLISAGMALIVLWATRSGLALLAHRNPTLLATFLAIGLIAYGNVIRYSMWRPFSLQLIHWIYVLTFFFIAPVAQYGTGELPWSMNIDLDKRLPPTNLLILAWCVTWMLFAQPARIPKSQEQARPWVIPVEWRRFSGTRVFLILAAVAFLMQQFAQRGLAGLFLRGAASDEASYTASSIDLLVNYAGRALPLGLLLLTVSRSRARGEKLTNPAVLGAGFVVLVTNFPLATARFWSALVAIGVLGTLGLLRRRWSLTVAVILGLGILMPVLGAARHATDVGEFMTALTSSENSEAWLTPDFDAYSVLTWTHEYVQQFGSSNGYQLLTSVLFFVPRTVWPSKGVGSGYHVAHELNLPFDNISNTLPAEGVINFGVLGVVVFAAVSALVCARIDGLYWTGRAGRRLGLLYPFLLGAFFFILRGDMLSSMSYTVGLIVPLLIVFALGGAQPRPPDTGADAVPGDGTADPDDGPTSRSATPLAALQRSGHTGAARPETPARTPRHAQTQPVSSPSSRVDTTTDGRSASWNPFGSSTSSSETSLDLGRPVTAPVPGGRRERRGAYVAPLPTKTPHGTARVRPGSDGSHGPGAPGEPGAPDHAATPDSRDEDVSETLNPTPGGDALEPLSEADAAEVTRTAEADGATEHTDASTGTSPSHAADEQPSARSLRSMIASVRGPLSYAGFMGIAQILSSIFFILVARAQGPSVTAEFMSCYTVAALVATFVDFGEATNAVRILAAADGVFSPRYLRYAGARLALVIGLTLVGLALGQFLPFLGYAIALGTMMSAQTFFIAAVRIRTGPARLALCFIVEKLVSISMLFLVPAHSRSTYEPALFICCGLFVSVLMCFAYWPTRSVLRHLRPSRAAWYGGRHMGIATIINRVQLMDVAVVTAFGSRAAAGSYAAVNRWGAPFNLYSQSVAQYMLPQYASAHSHAAARSLLRKTNLLLAPASVVLVLASLFSPAVVRVALGPKFSDSALALSVLCFAYIAAMYASSYYVFVQARHLDHLAVRVYVVSTIVQFAVLYPAVTWIGAAGASVAFLIGQVVLMIGCRRLVATHAPADDHSEVPVPNLEAPGGNS